MNQADLRTLADEGIKDAKALLDGGRWAFAYYAAGYAVECALKSCVLARMVHTGWVFKEKFKAAECLTHDLEELVRLADLQAEVDAHLAASPEFKKHWKTVTSWQVTNRYTRTGQAEAEELYRAITDDPNGVLKWIQTFW